MLPTKSMLDYMLEMNRLFPREDDIFLPPTPINQSMARSSSSTDTSPESFPDIIGYRYPEHLQTLLISNHMSADEPQARSNQRFDYPNNNFEPFPPPQIYETPLMARQQLPIVSRKIITENFVHQEMSNGRQNLTEETMISHGNQVKYYELFPSDGIGKQNESMRTSSHMSPILSNVSPRSTTTSFYESGMSPWTETMSEVSDFSSSPSTAYGRSPNSSKFPHALMPSRLSYQEPMYGPSASFYTSGRKVCSFCRRNGETPLVYTTHKVKEKIDGKYVVTCPILRSHICATCGATGDDAHTKSYCPIVCQDNNGKPLQSTTVRLKNTRLKSNGMRRF